jgi:hypothetical protein
MQAGIRRQFEIVTHSIDVWHVLEYDHHRMPDTSHGQFHEADTYVIRWHYSTLQIGENVTFTLKSRDARDRLQAPSRHFHKEFVRTKFSVMVVVKRCGVSEYDAISVWRKRERERGVIYEAIYSVYIVAMRRLYEGLMPINGVCVLVRKVQELYVVKSQDNPLLEGRDARISFGKDDIRASTRKELQP